MAVDCATGPRKALEKPGLEQGREDTGPCPSRQRGRKHPLQGSLRPAHPPGLREERIRGDHHIFTRDGIAEILNLQPREGKAKPYQVKQVRGVLTTYGLAGGPEGDAPGREEGSGEEEADDGG